LDVHPERITLLKVPIDIVKPEDLPDIISGLIPQLIIPSDSSVVVPNDYSVESRKTSNIVLLSVWDLLKARRNSEYREYLFSAVIIIPISKCLVTGVKFLTGKQVFRYMPFNFIISLLSILEKHEYPLYLLGGSNKILRKAEKNIHLTFPLLKIVGRWGGKIRRQEEPTVIEAIRKSSPSLLLAGKGIRGKELWIRKNQERLNWGFRLWCSDLFDVFAEKKRRPSDAVFNHGLEGIGYCFSNPLKFFRVFQLFYYNMLLVTHKLFKS
jgi:N-acetylglucosaminyldiphosphoundecaprenol N-acetyl-beta-D-mannosaminyltransferase